MNHSRFKRTTLQGQTLVIALIVLFVLLLIGFVFIGILNRNLVQANTSQQRSLAADLADAGIRYVREQLLDNPLGADWRPAPTPPLTIQTTGGVAPPPAGYTGPLFTTDPDEYYTRQAAVQQGTSVSGFATNRAAQGFGQPLHPGDLLPDMGGPDGLGPFSRVNFKNGRALIRVRYAPSDVNVTTAAAFGPLRNPGEAHNYLIIESVGRPGVLNGNDPTSLPAFNYNNIPQFETDQKYMNSNAANPNQPQAVEYQWFNSGADLSGAVAFWSQLDNQWVESRKLMAFATIGILDHARFVTNIHHSSNPAEIGISNDLGLFAYDDNGGSQAVAPPMVLGSGTAAKYNVPGAMNWPGGGSVQVNGNALIYGDVTLTLNQMLGEALTVAGTITGQNGLNSNNENATVTLNGYAGATPSQSATLTSNPTNDTLDSSSSLFSTEGGLIRDGDAGTDAQGNPRGVAYQPPPDLMHIDPNTGFNRYLSLTRDSGTITISGNSGYFGHGQGVYVNNGGGDLQIQNDENGYIAAAASQDLVNEWLSPNNNQPGARWLGPYYTPPGAYLQLLPDGFIIMLDGLGTNKTWKDSTGNDTGLDQIRYRISNTSPPMIIDSTTPGVSIDDPNPSFANGRPFNGVLYFEGNVRVRGLIPTYCPLTVVSMGNIYVEGSIVKGVTDSSGTVISNRTPQTGIALMARDYMVLNTTQFFGPTPNSPAVQEKNSAQNATTVNSVIVPAATPTSDFELWDELLLDPDNSINGTLANLATPQNWPTFSSEYKTANTNQPILTRMMLTQAMDDGPAADATISIFVNEGSPPPSAPDYVFEGFNGLSSIYQLGQNPHQVYPSFETTSFPLVTATNPSTNTESDPANEAYSIAPELPTFFGFQPNANPQTNSSNDYDLGGSAIVPNDVRIEAVMYAEEGSFFVIPGRWFNPNRSDVRYAGDASTANQENRLQLTGNDPYTPFYQEPLDVKITIVGSINENMPAPMSQQQDWDKKWSWIPATHGNSGEEIPGIHNGAALGAAFDVTQGARYVPNLYLVYDPMLATGRVNGFQPSLPSGSNPAIRTNPQDPTGLSMLPPLPCLPISPTLIYLGEVNS